MASEFAIRFAIHQIRKGGVIVYPTETVYGLGCDPMNADAVAFINYIKQRNSNKGLILIASNLQQLEPYIDVPDASDQIKLLPSKAIISWVVPAKNTAPYWLTGGSDTIAIRISRHPIVEKLCDQLGHPLVSTSANFAGKQPAKNALQLHAYFDTLVHAILVSGSNSSGTPSTIRSLINDQCFRA